MNAYEFNFDGLVGPTHNYSGLSFGNVASAINQGAVANPKLAALQGLRKMKTLTDLGFKQGVIAPHERPALHTLRALGFSGNDAAVIRAAAQRAPYLLNACSSASSMWVANAATVSPSADTADHRVHFTPANLNNKFHRSIEHHTTGTILRAMFRDESCFVHHPALPACPQFGDEGAANHTRFCNRYGEKGVEFFVYGMQGFNTASPAPQRYPARQTLEASQAITRLHGLDENFVVYAQQNPLAIDQGVFHNDVIAVGNAHLLFCHELAFLSQRAVLDTLAQKIGNAFTAIEVPAREVSLQDAVESYLFNSQLLSRPDGSMLLLVPEECRQNPQVWAYLNKLPSLGTAIREVLVMDLRESMRNGGGPACLRLRVELNEKEAQAVNPAVLLDETLYQRLVQWVEKHYRDRLGEADLADPSLLEQSRNALDELTRILELGSVYPFQHSVTRPLPFSNGD